MSFSTMHAEFGLTLKFDVPETVSFSSDNEQGTRVQYQPRVSVGREGTQKHGSRAQLPVRHRQKHRMARRCLLRA